MNETALYPKRKIVEIRLPTFSWKILFSFKAVLFFSILLFAMIGTYWLLAIHPFLWLSSGRVDGISVQIRSNESGMLSEVAVQDGDRVKKGQVLFSLESSRIFEREQKIEKDIVILQEEREFFKEQSEKAMQDYLSNLGILPQEDLEAHLQILQETQLKATQLQTEINAFEEERGLLKLQLEKCRIIAPFEGVVLKQKKGVGDFTGSGDSVLSLFDLNRSWIEVRIPEKNLHFIELGQAAKIRLPAYPGREWIGEVSWVGPATVSKIEGTASFPDCEEIPVKISFQKEGFPLKPGLSAEVGIKVH